jgi:rare lipoprotein A (peptidoglycan hydrolase)
MALIVMFAAVAVPGPVGSWAFSPNRTPSAELFASVEMAASVRGPVTATLPLDPYASSAGALDQRMTLREPDFVAQPLRVRPKAAQPTSKPAVVRKARWRLDGNISWYGPGFYGKRTACGVAMTRGLVGVAHRSLPCGTRVTFKNPTNGRVVTARVVDRGPYVSGRQWDMTGGLCRALGHCYTGAIYWKLGRPLTART